MQNAFLELLLTYAAYLQSVHGFILNLILRLIGKADSLYDYKDYLKAGHILFLNSLHMYLVYCTCKASRKKDYRLNLLQWIALIISINDWLSMDIRMTIWGPCFAFRLAGLIMLAVHFLPLLFCCLTASRALNEDGKLMKDPKTSWLISYAVFAGVFLLAAATGTVNYAATQIVQSLPWTDSHGLIYWLFSGCWTVYTLLNYYVVFPRITDQQKRPFSLFSFVFMGLVMGLCDSLVLTGAYRLTVNYAPSDWSIIVRFMVFVLLYLLPTAYYYAAVFNPLLAPDHRRPEYDLVKILTLTASDLLACFFVFVWQGFFTTFALQSLVLAGIVSSMRFPAPWYKSIDSLKLPIRQNK